MAQAYYDDYQDTIQANKDIAFLINRENANRENTKEIKSESDFTPNRYRIEGDKAFIILQTLSGDFFEAKIDAEDLDLVLCFGRWTLHTVTHVSGTSYSYARCTRKTEGVVTRTYLHRLITNAPSHLLVDHKNQNTLDDTKCNLRLCSYAENSQNRSAQTRYSSSGYRNIECYKNSNNPYYRVIFKEKNKTVYSERFETLEQAKESAENYRKIHKPFYVGCN